MLMLLLFCVHINNTQIYYIFFFIVGQSTQLASYLVWWKFKLWTSQTFQLNSVVPALFNVTINTFHFITLLAALNVVGGHKVSGNQNLFGSFSCTLLNIRMLTLQLSKESQCDVMGKQTMMLWLLFVGCLTSQQHASVSQGWICSDNFMCCHTETEVADQTFYLTQ